jgi:hypothetical protein
MSNAANARDFALEIDREWAAKEQDIDDLVHEIALETTRRIVLKSPVDTGRFRSNWFVSVNSPSAQITDQIRSNEQVVFDAEAVVMAHEKLPMVYIQNNLPYANRLENGWSKQAPAGMVSFAMAEIENMYREKEV